MLVEGDFKFSALFALVVVSFATAIGLLVRRKWRLAAARREEVKRLLVLASEEVARAELEDTVGFGLTTVATTPPRHLRYQCAVCFCPTTTRCAQCKSVWYCSGKCQIIHWRQGHKHECRLCVTACQDNDVGGSSGLKASKQESGSGGNNFQTEVRWPRIHIEMNPGEHSFSEQHGPDNAQASCLVENTETSLTSQLAINGRFSGSTVSGESLGHVSASILNQSEEFSRLQSTNVVYDKSETNCANMDPTMPSFKNHHSRADSSMMDRISENCLDGNAPCGTSSSSGWSIDGSNECSLSEPSTPSSGFWDGIIDSSRSRTDSFENGARSSFSKSGDEYASDHLSSISVSSELDRSAVSSVDAQGPSAKILVSGSTSPTVLTAKNRSGGSILSEEHIKSSSSPLLGSEMSSHIDGHTSIGVGIMKSRELGCSASSAFPTHPLSNARVHSIDKDNLKVSSSLLLSDEKLNNGPSGNNPSHAMRFREEAPLSFKGPDANISSSNGRQLVQNLKLLKVDRTYGGTDCSSQIRGQTPKATNGLKTSMWKVVDQLRVPKLSQQYPSGSGSGTWGRYSDKGLFPYEQFVKLYNWNKAGLQPCGLMNCGNSCYANAVLQCLAFTPPLTAYLLQGLHSKTCKKKERCFTCEFERLVMKAKEGTSPLSPIQILSRIQNIGSQLGNGREEDAHEFLRYAIDTMQSVCIKEAGIDASGSLEEETTLIGLTFGGYLRSKIQCLKCGGKSERHERMMDLSVEIEGDVGTLEEALQRFTGTEILEGENKYLCGRCKSYEKAKKKLTILEAPNVLSIALKRFQSGKYGKLNKSIHFPEILDLAPYMTGTSDKSPVYCLYGVVVHLDIMNAAFSGHYVCYVKNIQNNWFKIDDSTVKPVELESVLTKGAYILLYARCSPRAPRLVRNSIIPRDPRKPKNLSRLRSPSLGPWDCSTGDSLNLERFCANQATSEPIMWEESSSDKSSSFFSESGSCSTESSTRNSSSTDDYGDQIFGDSGHNWNSHRRTSSDFDPSSSSPSPLPSRYSSHGHTDLYVSRYPGSRFGYEDSTVGVKARIPRNVG